MSFAVRDFFADGGTDAVVVRLGGRGGDAPDGAVLTASDITCPGLEEDGRGLYALDRVDLFSLLVIPPHTRDGGLIPRSSANAALFYPRLRQPNPLRRREVGAFSAVGAVAGVIARTDAQVGVWASPAGPQALLNRVPALDLDLSTREVSALTAAGVNCLPCEGAFPASSRPSDGYFVKCGRDTMTEHDVESVLTVTVGFAPIRPGEFVVVRVQQAAGASH